MCFDALCATPPGRPSCDLTGRLGIGSGSVMLGILLRESHVVVVVNVAFLLRMGGQSCRRRLPRSRQTYGASRGQNALRRKIARACSPCQIPLPERLNEGELLVRMEAAESRARFQDKHFSLSCQVATICGSDLHTVGNLETVT